MRRTITDANSPFSPSRSKSELRGYLPKVVIKHPKYDYVLGTHLKHASMNLEKLSSTEYKKNGKKINWVTIRRSTDSVLKSLYYHYWLEWNKNGTGFAEFDTYLDWCFGIDQFNCDFYPNEIHAILEYRIWQAHMVNRHKMIAIDISETNDVIEFWGGEPTPNVVPKEQKKSFTEMRNEVIDNSKESRYKNFVRRLDEEKTDWYRVQLMCDELNVTKFEDFRKSATLGRNDVDSTSENSAKGLQESPQ